MSDVAAPVNATEITNRCYRLRARPTGAVTREHLELVSEAVPALEDGDALIRVQYLSLDPANRVWMTEADHYMEPVQIGEVMRGVGIGQVIASRRDDLAVGDVVSGMTGWQEHVVARGPGEFFPWTVLPSPLPAPIPLLLGVLGHTGISAYLGLELFGKPQPGETVVVSAAGGACGSVAGQIAKARGAHVVGIAGGPEKCRHVVETLGFDACVDYRAEGWREELVAATPDGVDVVFENVGGDILDASVERTNHGARVVICGMISVYTQLDDPPGSHWTILNLLMRRGTLHGFIIADFLEHFEPAINYLAGLLAEGRLHHDETIVDGIENVVDAFDQLFTGTNAGKLLIRLGTE